MTSPMIVPGWITNFDWERAGPEAHESTWLTSRLMAVAHERAALSGEFAEDEEAELFGRYIETLREARGWSRPLLAFEANVDPLAIPLLERASLLRDELTPDLVQRIARAFEIRVEELVISPIHGPLGPDITPAPAVGFGRWLAEMIQSFLAPPSASRALRGAIRGSGPRRPFSELDNGVLEHPISLPDQTLVLPDGEPGLAVVTLEPGAYGELGACDLRVRLVRAQDDSEQPVVNVVVHLELGHNAYKSEPTDGEGVAVLSGLSIRELTELEHLDLFTRAPR